jgi:membrane protease YdiL (CAAX protease family)
VVVNGYFLTRLSQRGWSPRAAFALSLAVRTSYHAYYGVGIFLTIPFGIMVTRSFQKHGRLGRSVLTHFLYDAPLLIIAVLTS